MKFDNATLARLLPDSDGLLAVAAVGVVITLLAWALLRASAPFSNQLRRRMQQMRTTEDGQPVSDQRWLFWLRRLAPYVEPRKPVKSEGLRELLHQSGLMSEHAVTAVYASKFLSLLLVALALVWAAMSLNLKGSALPPLAILSIFALYMSWRIPNLYVEKRVARRKRALMEGFPDALDLLVSCTEAGLGFNAAIDRVANELPSSHPELAGELHLVNAEIRAGVDRNDALRHLADRTGLEDVRGLVALMVQSMRFGTGIAETLRIYSEEFRDRRTQRAEEAAAKVGTKLIFPLVFCIFPAFFLVATGPAIVGVVRVVTGPNVVWPSGQHTSHMK